MKSVVSKYYYSCKEAVLPCTTHMHHHPVVKYVRTAGSTPQGRSDTIEEYIHVLMLQSQRLRMLMIREHRQITLPTNLSAC